MAEVGLPVKHTLSMPFFPAFLPSINLVFMDTAQGIPGAGGRHRVPGSSTAQAQGAVRSWELGHHHPKYLTVLLQGTKPGAREENIVGGQTHGVPGLSDTAEHLLMDSWKSSPALQVMHSLGFCC